ncbi:hypothetical protein [Pannonibacter phragmitetus]|uniref:hypothetical protein n=1 Tax=Pannonibacter phragmitetus TaxID=121719 RepID=UPI003D2EE02C
MKMLNRSTLAALILVIGQSAAMAQGSFLEHLLLSPTHTPGDVPETYGTAYDCRPLKAANQTAGVWRGLIGGQVWPDAGQSRPVSREGCFKTEQECHAFLNVMSGYIDFVYSKECRQL